MIVILSLILITSIWVLGVTVSTQHDMIFGKIREWAEVKESNWYKPLVLCVWCLPSLHSVIGYLFVFGLGLVGDFEIKYLFAYPLVVMGASFLSGFLWTLYLRIDREDPHVHMIDEYTSHLEESN